MNILGIDRTKKKNEELAANAKATLPFPTLKGKRITFSGKVAGHTRAQLTSLLKKHGAQIEDNLTHATHLLVIGRKGSGQRVTSSTKIIRAKQYKTPTATAEQFLKFLGK